MFLPNVWICRAVDFMMIVRKPSINARIHKHSVQLQPGSGTEYYDPNPTLADSSEAEYITIKINLWVGISRAMRTENFRRVNIFKF